MQKGWDAGDVLRGMLRETGLTQQQFADLVGIKRETFNAYVTENNETRRRLGFSNAERFALKFKELGIADADERLRVSAELPPRAPLSQRVEELERELAEVWEALSRLKDRRPRGVTSGTLQSRGE